MTGIHSPRKRHLAFALISSLAIRYTQILWDGQVENGIIGALSLIKKLPPLQGEGRGGDGSSVLPAWWVMN